MTGDPEKLESIACAGFFAWRPAAAGHIATALGDYLLARRVRGKQVPDEVVQLFRLTQFWARTGQDGSPLSAAVELDHDADVGPKLLLTLTETASRLSVSLSALKRLIADGQLVKVHVGGAARIRTTDLETYVNSLGGAA